MTEPARSNAERKKARHAHRRAPISADQETGALLAVWHVHDRGTTATLETVAAQLGIRPNRGLRTALDSLVAADRLHASKDDFGTTYYRPTDPRERQIPTGS